MPLLEIEPKSELKFKGPFNDIVTSEIIATNNANKLVCFKVKTTAPKQYCVRPNCGYIEPGQTVAITIMLQPIDLAANEKLKHKFLIQSIALDGAVPENPEVVWKTAKSEDIGEHKLRCVFDLEMTSDDRMVMEKQALLPEKGVHKEDQRTLNERLGLLREVQSGRLNSKTLTMLTALGVVAISILLGVVAGKYMF